MKHSTEKHQKTNEIGQINASQLHTYTLAMLREQLEKLKAVGVGNIEAQIKIHLSIPATPIQNRLYAIPKMVQAIRQTKGIKRFYYRANRKGIKMTFILSAKLIAILTK